MTTTLADDHPTARKQHICDDCGRAIQPGERYERFRGVGDDGPFTWKCCAQCETLRGRIWATDEWIRDVLLDEGIDLAEYLFEYRHDDLLAQFRARWAGVSAADLAGLDFGPAA